MKEEQYYRPLTDIWKGVRIQAFGLNRFEVVCAEEELIAHLRLGFDTSEDILFAPLHLSGRC